MGNQDGGFNVVTLSCLASLEQSTELRVVREVRDNLERICCYEREIVRCRIDDLQGIALSAKFSKKLNRNINAFVSPQFTSTLVDKTSNVALIYQL